MPTPIVRLHPTPAAAEKLPRNPVTGDPAPPVWEVSDGPVPSVGQIFQCQQAGCDFKVISVKESRQGSVTCYDADIDVANSSLVLRGANMELQIEAITRDANFSRSWEIGARETLYNGADLEYRGPAMVKADLGVGQILHFVVHTATNIDVSLLANALYDKFKSAVRVKINKSVITTITKDSIQMVLEEEEIRLRNNHHDE
ncbi:MAG: hypothetical protein ACYDBH_03005 [Acidobacteriaceae bacterium]